MKKILLIMLSLFFLTGCATNTAIAVLDTSEELQVIVNDQFTQNLELLISQFKSNFTLENDLVLGQRVFNITAPIIPLVDDVLCLKDIDGNLFTQDKIFSVVSLGSDRYTITILGGVEFPYSVEDACSIRTSNMAVDGSVTEQYFKISPIGLDVNVEWDITRLICDSLGVGFGSPDPTPDSSSFFNSEATDKGMLFMFKNNVYYKNLFYVRNNYDFQKHMFDVEITPANKNGFYSTNWRKSLNGNDKSGVVARLSADPTSTLYHEAVIRVDRDLTSEEIIECIYMGHETTKYTDSLN